MNGAGANLSTADSLLAGKGFVDMLGAPFVLWPPLYPLVMAGLSLLTGWSTFQSAWYLNVVLYALNIWLARLAALSHLQRQAVLRGCRRADHPALTLDAAHLRQRGLGAALRDASCCFSSWPPHAICKKPHGAGLWAMFVLAGLATLQRYLGVVLFGVAALAVFYKERWRGLSCAAACRRALAIRCRRSRPGPSDTTCRSAARSSARATWGRCCRWRTSASR